MNQLFRTRVARWLDRFLAPLEHALRLRERAFLFRVTGGGEKENFRFDLFRSQFAPLDFGRVVPKCRAFDLDHVAHDQPFQFASDLRWKREFAAADRGFCPSETCPSIFRPPCRRDI